jgi:hypothetical protein
VIVSGTGLSLSTQVTFTGGAMVTPTAVTATSLKIVVPSGALTGPVTITNPMGTGISTSSFTALPRITNVTPRGGLAGAAITIVGTNLKVGADHPQVYIGGVRAAVDRSSPTAVVVAIPSGAPSARVALTTVDGTATSATSVLVTPRPVVESALHKTTSRTGTAIERVVDVRFRPQPGDFFTVTVSDGVSLADEPLVLHGQLAAGGRAVDDFRLRRVLDDFEEYPPADRQFTIVATPATGGEPIVFQTTPQTLGGLDQLTIFEVDNPRVTAAPTILTSIVAPGSSIVGSVEEVPGTVVEVLGCLGPACSFRSLGTAVASHPFWSLSPPVALSPGDRVKARATAPGKFTGLNSSTVTVLSVGQLPAAIMLDPISPHATSVFGFAPSGSSVELFTRTPAETSLGFAVATGITWHVGGLSPLRAGQELFAVARQAGFTDSPPTEPVVVGAPAQIARFDFGAVATAPLTVAWDAGGISSPIAILRLSITVASSDATLSCAAQEDYDGHLVPLPTASVQVTVPGACAGTTGQQSAASGRLCVGVIDDQARQTDHCLVFD